MKTLLVVVALVAVLSFGGMASEALEANTSHYWVPVGTHVVSFNTSVPLAEHENIYHKTSQVGIGDSLYDTSVTFLMTSVNKSPLLMVEVRDFKRSIPEEARVLEYNTLERFASYASHPIMNYWFSGVVANWEGEYCGTITKWPSDQTEIVITGSLPSIEIWEDIIHSVTLER